MKSQKATERVTEAILDLGVNGHAPARNSAVTYESLSGLTSINGFVNGIFDCKNYPDRDVPNRAPELTLS